MNTKKITITIIIIAIAIVIAGAVASSGKSSNPESLKIGIMLPLTGLAASAGENMRKGAEIAIENYKKENPNVQIEVVFEDDAFDVTKGFTAYKKLVDLDKVDAILMVSTPVLDAIHEDVVARGIPLISVGVQTVGVADDNIIQFSPAAEAPIGHLAKYLNDSLDFNSKKTAVMYENSPGPISFFNAFDTIYSHEFDSLIVNSKEDLRGYATKIANENYDSVVFIMNPETGALATKELLNLDDTMPLLAYDAQLQTGFGDYERILGDMNKINGAISMWFKAGETEKLTELYMAKYGEAPGFLADFSYDMVNTALLTYDKNPASWVENLKKYKNTNGASGAISFDAKGVRIQPMVITEVQEGKLVPTE